MKARPRAPADLARHFLVAALFLSAAVVRAQQALESPALKTEKPPQDAAVFRELFRFPTEQADYCRRLLPAQHPPREWQRRQGSAEKHQRRTGIGNSADIGGDGALQLCGPGGALKNPESVGIAKCVPGKIAETKVQSITNAVNCENRLAPEAQLNIVGARDRVSYIRRINELEREGECLIQSVRIRKFRVTAKSTEFASVPPLSVPLKYDSVPRLKVTSGSTGPNKVPLNVNELGGEPLTPTPQAKVGLFTPDTVIPAGPTGLTNTPLEVPAKVIPNEQRGMVIAARAMHAPFKSV